MRLNADVVFEAAADGNLELMKKLMDEGHATDLKHPDLLSEVVSRNHGHVLDFMLDNGADLQQARLAYVTIANRQQRALAAVHATLQCWSNRSLTFLSELPAEMETLEDLRKTDPDFSGKPLTRFIQLARRGSFDKVMDIIRNAKEDSITIHDLLATDSYGNSLLEILGERKQLEKLFAPELWVGRLAEMQKIYLAAPPVYQDQIDYPRLVSEERQKFLKSRASSVAVRLKKGNRPV